MKKSTKLIVALLVVVAALAVTYRLMHRVPSADLEANAQMQQIITDAGCLRCHTSTPDLPFYASMPVAGKIVMEDVSKAYRAFDMTQMEADLEAGQPLNPADLAKIEKVILDGKMPQAKYYLVHWGATLMPIPGNGARTAIMYDLTGRPAACSPVRRRKDFPNTSGVSRAWNKRYGL